MTIKRRPVRAPIVGITPTDSGPGTSPKIGDTYAGLVDEKKLDKRIILRKWNGKRWVPVSHKEIKAKTRSLVLAAASTETQNLAHTAEVATPHERAKPSEGHTDFSFAEKWSNEAKRNLWIQEANCEICGTERMPRQSIETEAVEETSDPLETNFFNNPGYVVYDQGRTREEIMASFQKVLAKKGKSPKELDWQMHLQDLALWRLIKSGKSRKGAATQLWGAKNDVDSSTLGKRLARAKEMLCSYARAKLEHLSFIAPNLKSIAPELERQRLACQCWLEKAER